jgi:hypothetical protein
LATRRATVSASLQSCSQCRDLVGQRPFIFYADWLGLTRVSVEVAHDVFAELCNQRGQLRDKRFVSVPGFVTR